MISTALNALLLYLDRPFSIGPLWGVAYDEETKRRERFLIAEPQDLDESVLYAKERRLVEMVHSEARNRRAVQIYATYTQKRDVTRRLESVLTAAGIKAAVLTTQTPPEAREAWYDRQLRAGVQAFIGHPRLVQTGLDYVEYESGRALFRLKPVCIVSDTAFSEDAVFAHLLVLRITVASRMTRQPFRARAALSTNAATSSIWSRGKEKAAPSIFSANAMRNRRSPWKTTREYASHAYANNSRWRNSISTKRPWPRRTLNR